MSQASAPGSVLLMDTLNKGFLDASRKAFATKAVASIDHSMTALLKQIMSQTMTWGCPDSPEQVRLKAL